MAMYKIYSLQFIRNTTKYQSKLLKLKQLHKVAILLNLREFMQNYMVPIIKMKSITKLYACVLVIAAEFTFWAGQ